jgi:hydroxyacylglutathione hydrolase
MNRILNRTELLMATHRFITRIFVVANMKIKKFTFNPFQENTYVLSDETDECVIIDPGCYFEEEKKEISDYIGDNKLTPVKIFLTHCHIDHILGNNFLTARYKIPIFMDHREVDLLKAAPVYGQMWGIEAESSPDAGGFLEEGGKAEFGKTSLDILFTPGHSQGSVSFFHKEHQIIFSGDVLFNRSIGRTDLPGGDFDTLISSIREKLFPLGDDVIVYSGHGPETTIGEEKKYNPFL